MPELDTILERNLDVLEVIAELQRYGADFAWYEHPGKAARPIMIYPKTSGLTIGVGMVNDEWVWNLELREKLEEWREPINDFVQEVFSAAGIVVPKGHFAQLPRICDL